MKLPSPIFLLLSTLACGSGTAPDPAGPKAGKRSLRTEATEGGQRGFAPNEVPVDRARGKRLEFVDLDAAPALSFAGSVVDSHGKAVSGALVALVRPNIFAPVATTISDADGSFAMAAPAGTYAITVTASGKPSGYVEARAYGTDSARGEIQLAMSGPAFTHSGRLHDDFGLPIAGALVGIYRHRADLKNIWYTRTALDGSFSLTVRPVDKYTAFVVSDTFYSETVSLSGRADQSVALSAMWLGSAVDEVLASIKKTAVHLDTVEAGSGLDDMKGLRKLVGKARVVALGEATHGTREFFQMKHRVLEYLVRVQGFTVFAIEANFTETLAINDYVLHGAGDAATALAGIYFWTWNTEAVLAQIEWMRAYNRDPKHDRKLKFYGFDMQSGAVAAKQLLAYFQTVDPDHAKTVSLQLGEMQSEAYLRGNAASVGPTLVALRKRLHAKRKRYRERAGRWAWQIALQNAQLLNQQRAMHLAGDRPYAARAQAMAANLRWILDVEPKGTRVVVSTHNGHVSKNGSSGIKSMGTHLAQALGERYLAVGFAFHRGGFQAIDGTMRVLKAHKVGPSPVDTVGATFSRAGCSICVLDLRTPPKGSMLALWLAHPRRMREIGEVYTTEKAMLTPSNLPARFDALVFIDRTTRARPVKRAPKPRLPSTNKD